MFRVYADESGDHKLPDYDVAYPIFVLNFCVFRQDTYDALVRAPIDAFKTKHCATADIVLHEADIRRQKNGFEFLADGSKRDKFYSELGTLLDGIPFDMFAAVIRKDALCNRYLRPFNPYYLALKFGLERLHWYVEGKHRYRGRTVITFESRGRKEDADLMGEFHRVCAGDNHNRITFPFDAEFATKADNMPGHQVADLLARPIGRHVLNPAQRNRALATVNRKLVANAYGEKQGFGLKVFP